MRICLFCNQPLPLLRKFASGGPFCSADHACAYQDLLDRRALERLSAFRARRRRLLTAEAKAADAPELAASLPGFLTFPLQPACAQRKYFHRWPEPIWVDESQLAVATAAGGDPPLVNEEGLFAWRRLPAPAYKRPAWRSALAVQTPPCRPEVCRLTVDQLTRTIWSCHAPLLRRLPVEVGMIAVRVPERSARVYAS